MILSYFTNTANMSMKIGIIGDPHASADPVVEALQVFQQVGVDEIWCTGDVAGYGEELEQTLELLVSHKVHIVEGNHEAWYLRENPAADNFVQNYFRGLSRHYETSIGNKKLYLVHAAPPDRIEGGIRLLDQTGEVIPQYAQYWENTLVNFHYDVLVVGHTHQVFAMQLGSTLVINPGSPQYNHACAILDVDTMAVQWIPLSGNAIQKTWNWGDQVGRA